MTLASMLNKDDTADLAYQLLSQRPQLSRDHLVLRLLETSECNWSINLKLQFIKSLRQALKKWEKNWQARSIIDGLAQKLPVEMLEDLENIAPHDQNHALFASYKELLASISFRKDMLAALET